MSAPQVKTRLLSQDDLIQVGVQNMPECVDVIEGVFKLLAKGDYLMGGPRENEHGQMIWFPEEKRFNIPVTGPDRRFMAMIAYLGGEYDICGEKWYGSNAENKKKGLPRSILTTVLNDADTGVPFAIMSGNMISAMRTGAVPGVAARHLARKGATTIGAIGAGVINKTCSLAIAAGVDTISEAVVYDPFPAASKSYAVEMEEKLGLNVRVVDTIKEAVEAADVITIATSGDAFPRIETEWLKKGTLLTMTGAADMDEDAFHKCTLFADNWKMHQAFIADGNEHPKGFTALEVIAPSYPLIKLVNDGKVKESVIRDLGPVILGDDAGRKSDDEQIIFVTGGMPVHDLAWGMTLYRRAVEKGLGQDFTFF